MKNTNRKNSVERLPFDNRHFYIIKSFHYSLRILVILLSFIVFSLYIPVGINKYISTYNVDAKISENNIELDINSNIKIDFNQPVFFFNRDDITIVPKIDFDFEMLKDKESLIIKPKKSLLPEHKYELYINNIRGISGLELDKRKLTFFTKKMSIDDGENLSFNTFEKKFSELSLS